MRSVLNLPALCAVAVLYNGIYYGFPPVERPQGLPQAPWAIQTLLARRPPLCNMLNFL